MVKKINNWFDVAWAWLVRSSADPKKYSLALRGAGGLVITYTGFTLGLFHYNLPADQAQTLLDQIVWGVEATLTAVSYVLTAISVWAAAWGTLRKILLTLMGAHPVQK